MEYFHIQHTLFAVSDRKYIKDSDAGKERKA